MRAHARRQGAKSGYPEPVTLLATYLQDHFGASTGGVELARRAAGANRDHPVFGAPLERLAAEIAQDRETLRRIMRALDVDTDRLKTAAGWAGEKLGRLKPNGRLLSYSPLSRVVELEVLSIAVTGKLGLWRTLRELAGADPRLDGPALDGLIARAEAQQETLQELRRDAAAIAFGPGDT